MERARVDELLKNYHENMARCEYLTARVNELDVMRARAVRNVVAENVNTVQVLSDMPRGGKTSDPTARLGAILADGIIPDSVADIEAAILEAQAEIRERKRAVSYVNAWLNGLNERERYVIERKILQDEFWRCVVDGFNERFGEIYTKPSVRRIVKHGLEKIYRIAK